MNELRLGTAEWTDPSAFAAQHTFRDGRFWLGRSPMGAGDGVGYVDDRHICLVSGSRSGKGTTTIIPNLCLWPGSVVVVDPKGENATVAAARRGPGSEHCEGMGQAVHVLDPFEEAQVAPDLRSRFNPMDALDPADPEVIEEVSRIAEALVVVNEGSESASWERSARSMVKGLILHVLTSPRFEGRRNLVTVRELLTRGDHESLAELRKMDVTPLPNAQALLWEGLARNTALGGVISGIGEQFADQHKNAPKQFIGAHGPAVENTEFIDSPRMRECLGASDFHVRDLKTDPRGVSIFLSLPQRHMDRHYRWLRLMVALITSEMQATRGRPATGHPILMCLDEFAGLKRMEVIENAVAQIAGYGVKLFFVLQSLEQLKSLYKDNWETFLANSSLKLFFGVEDHFTREYASKLLGDTEVIRTTNTSSQTEGSSESNTQGRTESKSTGRSWTRGKNWGRSSNKGRSEGSSRSNSFEALPLNLRGTASFFAALTGDRQHSDGTSASDTEGTGTSSGKSRSRGGNTSRSVSQSESTTTGTSSSTTQGTSEGVHKRPLINPDEVGRFFTRITDRQNPLYPGFGLAVISGQHPAVVRRTNYFEDPAFTRLFDPHPDHPLPSPPKMEAVENADTIEDTTSNKLTDILVRYWKPLAGTVLLIACAAAILNYTTSGRNEDQGSPPGSSTERERARSYISGEHAFVYDNSFDLTNPDIASLIVDFNRLPRDKQLLAASHDGIAYLDDYLSVEEAKWALEIEEYLQIALDASKNRFMIKRMDLDLLKAWSRLPDDVRLESTGGDKHLSADDARRAVAINIVSQYHNFAIDAMPLSLLQAWHELPNTIKQKSPGGDYLLTEEEARHVVEQYNSNESTNLQSEEIRTQQQEAIEIATREDRFVVGRMDLDLLKEWDKLPDAAKLESTQGDMHLSAEDARRAVEQYSSTESTIQ